MPIRKEEPNYTFLIQDKIEELRGLPDPMTFGEIVYTFLRYVRPEQPTINKREFLEISDKEIYTALCKAYQREIEND